MSQPVIPRQKPGPKKKWQRDPLVGMTIGKLKVLTRLKDRKTGSPNTRACVLVLCLGCNTRSVQTRAYLTRKDNPLQHCGCQNPTITGGKFKIEYSAWSGMIARCYNVKHTSYREYGARGITVCEQWRDKTPDEVQGTPKGFMQFLKDMGPRPKDHPTDGPYSLDRIEANGHYEPSNLQWATAKQQARNKRNTKWVTHPTTGKPIKAADLAEELGLTYQVLRNRLIAQGKW
jgi:hypothetical protein